MEGYSLLEQLLMEALDGNVGDESRDHAYRVRGIHKQWIRDTRKRKLCGDYRVP